MQNHKKNRQLAQNAHLNNLIDLIAEHLLPQYCVNNRNKPEMINKMHNLCFLLASKAQAVFTSGVIRTCIDQNWDLKGFRSTIIGVLSKLGIEDHKKLQDFFDKMIQSQNLQSSSCIKSISYFIKNSKKDMDEDDLKNPIVSFQTTFDFVKNDIQRFRSQNMKYECFQVLHPWAYDLDQVDFKYVINKDQAQSICKALKNSKEAQVFWLSFFKSQLSASADEFIGALKELCIMNHIPDYFDTIYDQLKKFMIQNDFAINVSTHSDKIIHYIASINEYALQQQRFSVLRDQIKIRSEARQKTEYIDESKISSYKITNDNDLELVQMKLSTVYQELDKKPIDLRRYPISVKPNVKQESNLFLKFTNVDTEELKDLEIKVDGNIGQFKIGEGDCNHYVISNDKKLWESQFMIISKNGKYYIRDLGVVHTSRLKVTNKVSLQLHQGALIDLGKVVHYHINKLTHEANPVQDSVPEFIVMKGSKADYKRDDEAILKARPTWISQDENKDLVQNEIMLESSQKQNIFQIGRSNKRDVEIKLKAVSADHCRIEYTQEKGWYIHEKGKDRLSSNGTFVFMKSINQMDDHEPSDIIPLFNGMIISFINYELQVRIEPKNADELKASIFEQINLEETPREVKQHSQRKPKEEEVHQPPQFQDEVPPHQEAHHEHHHQQRSQQEDPYNEEFQATKQQHSKQALEEEQSHHSQNKSLQQDDVKSQRDLEVDEEKPSSESPQKQSQQDAQSMRQSMQSLREDQSRQSLQRAENEEEVKSEGNNKPQVSLREKESPQKEELAQLRQSVDQQSARSSHQMKEPSQNNEVEEALEEKAQEQLEEERKSDHFEESPKNSAYKQKTQDEEEQIHEIKRSYSQHYIGEEVEQQRQSQSQLSKRQEQRAQSENQEGEVVLNKSVHEEEAQKSDRHHEEHKNQDNEHADKHHTEHKETTHSHVEEIQQQQDQQENNQTEIPEDNKQEIKHESPHKEQPHHETPHHEQQPEKEHHEVQHHEVEHPEVHHHESPHKEVEHQEAPHHEVHHEPHHEEHKSQEQHNSTPKHQEVNEEQSSSNQEEGKDQDVQRQESHRSQSKHSHRENEHEKSQQSIHQEDKSEHQSEKHHEENKQEEKVNDHNPKEESNNQEESDPKKESGNEPELDNKKKEDEKEESQDNQQEQQDNQGNTDQQQANDEMY